ncbi:hypothetical protein PSYMO_37087, partial [Pseudomonas amygdali pv. mori str. 301020]
NKRVSEKPGAVQVEDLKASDQNDVDAVGGPHSGAGTGWG